MNTALWIIPRSKLEENMAWVKDATDGQVKLVGLVEVLGGIGLILPAALDIAPILVPLAATGLVLTMVGAVITHAKLKDSVADMVPAVVLGALAAFVAVLRFGSESF